MERTADAEVGHDGGEGVVGDLGLGVGDGSEEGRLAGVGHSYHTDIGEQLQLQVQPPPLPLFTELSKARHRVLLGLELPVAAPALAAVGHPQQLPLRAQVAEQHTGLLVAHDGAHGHAHDKVLRCTTHHAVCREACLQARQSVGR